MHTSGVHPHSRGENIEALESKLDEYGSSPLARGKLVGFWSGIFNRRFIPTRAGKIAAKYLLMGLGAVHPHSRGENLTIN